MNRKTIFDAVRRMLGRGFSDAEVRALDRAVDGAERRTPTSAGVPRAVIPAGVDLIRRWEGCRLQAYLCPAGVPTIGYGATGPEVRPGLRWTQEQAEARLEEDVARFAAGVDGLLGSAPTSDEQFAAMVSLAFNVGLGAFAGSTLLAKHRAGDHAGALREFRRWCRAGGRVLAGLVDRRVDEARLYRRG